MERFICIHGHFYQPPRENPWLEEVEMQDSASPYHDWNDRITAECYAPNTASRILGAEGKIGEIINNYSRISFNIGPTLLSWMERHRKDIYDSILEADRLSRERFSGHGSAVAQVYNHMIMPLANRRDKITQVRWGIKDFESRFGRFPEGMWLSEAAVDLETLEVLAEEGIKFTVLAPRQAKRVKALAKGSRWHDVHDSRIDPTKAYQCQLPSGKSIALFFYDGPIAQDLAFGDILDDGLRFANRLLGAFHDDRPWNQLVHIATDGESYGHHHRHGDMALSYCLHHIETSNEARLTNYGEYLERCPPSDVVEIYENSSWSCVHGIERWRDNCGCNAGHAGWTQAWRKPLREALDRIRDEMVPVFEHEAGKLLKDVWRARDEYFSVVRSRSAEGLYRFFFEHASHVLTNEEVTRALMLLEMQRNAMLMYTSCGWFFDEISGIEATQILQYASMAIQYAEAISGRSLEPAFLQDLAKAPSNVLESGARAYELYAKPARVDLLRVAAHYGISSIFVRDPAAVSLYCYTATIEHYSRLEAGKCVLAIGKLAIRSELTLEQRPVSFAVLHLGDHNLSGGVRDFMSEEAFGSMQKELRSTFETGDMTNVLNRIGSYFGSHNYTLWHLFRDEQRRVLLQILGGSLNTVETSLRKIFEENHAVMNLLHSLHIPIPSALFLSAQHFVNSELRMMFAEGTANLGRLEGLIQQVQKWKFPLDKDLLRFAASQWITTTVERILHNPTNIDELKQLNGVLKLVDPINLDLDLWKAQNIYFERALMIVSESGTNEQQSDSTGRQWREQLDELGVGLHVKVGS